MDTKLHNLLYFTIIFLSGDLNLLHQSPDYILEKFNLYIGNIDINKHTECDLFKEYKKIWKKADYRINSILLYFINVYNYYNYLNKDIDPFGEEDWNEIDKPDMKWWENVHPLKNIENMARKPHEYIDIFNKWIGEFEDIKNIKIESGLHMILKMKIYDIYKNYFKEFL